jgi:hypothetical protein
MLRIDASRMSMNWTRLSSSRIATPRRDESDGTAGSRSDGRTPAWDWAVMSLASLSLFRWVALMTCTGPRV